MRKSYIILIFVMTVCTSCEWKLRLDMPGLGGQVAIERYDRIEALYLTTGDFSALQQMNIDYPMETRTLIEDVLKIGEVSDRNISNRFLHFFQDSTLQAILTEVSRQFADMEDINREFTKGFSRLQREIPGIDIPKIYTQIGALDQSVIVSNNTLGICLDKYLGMDFAPYHRYYPLEQRRQMTRSMIVPDCLHYYILSLFPLPSQTWERQQACDLHMARIQWVVNKIIERKAFTGRYVDQVDRYMQSHKNTTVLELLSKTE